MMANKKRPPVKYLAIVIMIFDGLIPPGFCNNNDQNKQQGE